MDVSVIIPVFRGYATIRLLFEKIKETLTQKYEYEVIFIEDNGSKKNIEEIASLKHENPDIVKGYRLNRNYGQHRALIFGFLQASGNFIITLDEDLQHNPEDFLKLIDKQREGDYDVVYANFENLEHPKSRKLISRIFRKRIKLILPDLYFNYSPYRLIRNSVAKGISYLTTPYVFIDDYLSRITKKISDINVQHHNRLYGKSSYTIPKILKNGFMIMITYTRILSWLIGLSILLLISGSLLYFLKTTAHMFEIQRGIDPQIIILVLTIGLLFMLSGLYGLFIRKCNLQRNSKAIRFNEIS